MSANDKLLRVVISFGIAMLYYFNIIYGITGIVFMLAAIVLLLTSFFRFCPLYHLFGYSTCTDNKKG